MRTRATLAAIRRRRCQIGDYAGGAESRPASGMRAMTCRLDFVAAHAAISGLRHISFMPIAHAAQSALRRARATPGLIFATCWAAGLAPPPLRLLVSHITHRCRCQPERPTTLLRYAIAAGRQSPPRHAAIPSFSPRCLFLGRHFYYLRQRH